MTKVVEISKGIKSGELEGELIADITLWLDGKKVVNLGRVHLFPPDKYECSPEDTEIGSALLKHLHSVAEFAEEYTRLHEARTQGSVAQRA